MNLQNNAAILSLLLTNHIANKPVFDNWSISQLEVDICSLGYQIVLLFHYRLLSQLCILIMPSKNKVAWKLYAGSMLSLCIDAIVNKRRLEPNQNRRCLLTDWWLFVDLTMISLAGKGQREYGVDLCVCWRPLATIVPARQTRVLCLHCSRLHSAVSY